MNGKAYPFIAYINYWLKKEDAYSLQSPYLFQLYNRLSSFLKSRETSDLDIEEYRKNLLNSQEYIHVLDLGAGSKSVNQPQRPIAGITRYSTSARKYAQLYQFFCSLTDSKIVLELGTCVGISSRYLAKIAEKGKVYSFEGAEELAKLTQADPAYQNLEVITGDLAVTLPDLLQEIEFVDFALIDATHTYASTMSYFNQLLPKLKPNSILVIGDIHWSAAMTKAWKAIKSHERVRLSLDYYECGVVFFEYSGQKSDYILDF